MKARFKDELARALINAAMDDDCWDAIPETDFDRWASDAEWALAMVEARQARRKMRFDARVRFDDELRPRLGSGAIIAYPDALYHAGAEDVTLGAKPQPHLTFPANHCLLCGQWRPSAR